MMTSSTRGQTVLISIGIAVAVGLIFEFLGLLVSSDVYWIAVAAIWAAVAAVGTCCAVFVAWYQIGEIKRQQRGWETLRVCGLYDIDPTIDRAVSAISRTDSESGNYEEISVEATTVLNYFTSLAVGIKQGFYDEKIVRAHLERVMRTHIDDLLVGKHAEQIGITAEDFKPLRALIERWNVFLATEPPSAVHSAQSRP